MCEGIDWICMIVVVLLYIPQGIVYSVYKWYLLTVYSLTTHLKGW